MNRLEQHLKTLQDNGEKGLILYITAGDPDIATSLEIMRALADNGADCIELGVPFTDPIADGPVIQRASQRALQHDVNLKQIMDMVSRFRADHETPVLLMGYYNSFYQYGLNGLTTDLEKAGIDGLIVADLPWEESEELETDMQAHNLSLIRLLAPELSNDRTRQIIRSANGFIYCVSTYGTTGGDSGENTELAEIINTIKQETDTPVAIGFGISSHERAAAAAKLADCVIVGSWLISELEQAADKVQHAAGFTRALKDAL